VRRRQDGRHLRLGSGAASVLAVESIGSRRADAARPRVHRGAYFKGYAEKSYKNLIQGQSGAPGNAATRLEEFVAKSGAFAYGSYSDIEALFQEQASQLDRNRREAKLHEIQQLVHDRTIYAGLLPS